MKNFNFKIFINIIIILVLPIIILGEISPILRNSGDTIMYYLGTATNIFLIYVEYLLIKNTYKEMVKNEKG